MDDIKRPKVTRSYVALPTRLTGVRATQTHHQTSLQRVSIVAPQAQIARRTITINLKPWQGLYRLGQSLRSSHGASLRMAIVLMVLLLVASEFIMVFEPHVAQRTYAIGNAKLLLPAVSQAMEKRLTHDPKQAAYTFNAGYTPLVENKQESGGPKITAVAYEDPLKGVLVTDPLNNIDFTMKPKFALLNGKQEGNRVIYPLKNGTGWLVYTMQGVQVKEDILLKFTKSDHMTLTYEMNLGTALAMRLQSDGSVGVYGTDLPLNGNVATGSDIDKELLQKAREKADKNKLIFTIPAPVVNEYNQTKSDVQAKYIINGKELKVEVKGLKKANYPLSIDPSVYVTSAQQFMRGNNESNVDFDTTNDLIQKSKLTGARISDWTTDLALNSARWSAGYAVGGGYAYVVGGSSGASNTSTVYWAQFSPTANTMNTPPNPGTGVSGCNSSAWCTNTAYNLPANRSGLSSAVYNGYLYAVGGTDSSCAGTNNVCSTVYYAKLGANGEPISWAATSTLVTGRRFAGVAVYNNKMYVVGGQTNTTLNGDQTIEAANVLPDGTLGTFSTTGMTSIPTAGRWGMTVLQNNGYLYLIGGASTTTTANTVQYIKLNSDGTMSSSWVTTSAFTNARATFGGMFATVYGGYMYITTGCATLTTTACSTFTPVTFTGSPNTQTDFQYASINADGSLTGWTVSAQHTTSPVVNGTPLTSAASTAMTGYGLVAWRGALYGIGGCTAVSTATNCSGTAQTQVTYGAVNADGDVSPIFGSASSNFFNGTNYLNDLPTAGTTAGTGGRIASGVVVNNGFIYNIAGCATIGCTTMSPRTSYAAINSDGTLGAWTVSTFTMTTAVAAFGVTVYNNVIYMAGGFNGGNDVSTGAHVALATTGDLAANWTQDTGVLAATYAYPFIFARAIPNNGTQGYLYIIGGCTGGAGIGCTGYRSDVRQCIISNAGGAPGTCVTTGTAGRVQLQLGVATGIFGGAVYGDYVYLSAGANSLSGANVSATGATCTADPNACGGQTDIVQYAFINSSGNITRSDGVTTTGGWHVASDRLTRLRRRTVSFAINGYLYIVAGHDGSGTGETLNDLQRGKINVETGDVTGFVALSTTITDRWDLRAAQANGYIYILGGCTTGPPPGSCSVMNGVGEYVQVYNNWSGSPASYTSSANRPTTDRYGASAAVVNGYLYLAGGCTSTAQDCSSGGAGTASTDISFSQLAADGSIGTWTVATNTLTTNGTTPAPRAFGGLETVGGTLYMVGGQINSGAAQTTVLYSTPSAANGQPAAWATATNGLGAAKSQLSTVVYNNRIYATGGYSGTNATPTNSVYYSPDLSAGGNITSAWTLDAGTSFQLNRSGHSAVAYGNNLYIMGGYDGTNYLIDVQFAPIASDGSIGTWTYGTSLPQLARQADAFASNGFMYVFGGRSATTTCTNNTYVAPINADGSLGVWSQTNIKYNIVRWGLAAAYDSGRAYILGGICNGTLTANDRAVYGTLQLQPQLANYSLMIDTDTDVFPSKYLINGLDNGIGAAWFLKYISSTSATNSWGQSTNAGKVTLGTPGTYTPKDGSGTNTNFARYYMLFLTIDDQQAFGFPEDITRGPNIYDITLLFTSDPGKRLIHGKTFVGGVQQPLDTPF